jgi:hypothetical protein
MEIGAKKVVAQLKTVLMVEATGSSEMLVIIYQTIRLWPFRNFGLCT